MPRLRHALLLVGFACTSSAPPPQDQTKTVVTPPRPVLPPPVSQPPPEPPQVPAQPPGEFDVSGPGAGGQTSTPPVRKIQYAKLDTRWTAKVGKTTFRTTMAFTDGHVLIGTHGASLDGKNEATDGVYLLDPKTGAQVRLIKTPGSGDRDVGGIAVDRGTIYFTADNSQIVAAALDGKILWTADASGKVRPAPALADLDGDGGIDLVVGDEFGVLRALKGADGKPLWTVGTGESEYNHRGFVAAAAIADLDGDGRDDVIAASRDTILTAYKGKDGAVLWQHGGTAGVHASPSVADFDHDGKPEVLAAWSYGQVSIHDGKTGAVRWGTQLERDDGGIEGLFSTPTPLPGKPGVLVTGTAWWDDADGVILVGVDARMSRAFEGRVSASAVVVDLDGDGREEAILGSEKGHLLAFTADGGRAELAKLHGPIEAPAMLADLDADGKQELLVASNDGLLTCFATGATARPYVSRFRGESLHNRGDLGKTSLGWRSGKPGSAPQQPAPGAGIRIDYLRCCQDLTDNATRAPAPDNTRLLQAAAKCNALAAVGMERAGALKEIQTAAAGAELPSACR